MKKVTIPSGRRADDRRSIMNFFAATGYFFKSPMTRVSSVVVLVLVVASCSDIKRNPGKVYMPDMAYSRAYETYSMTEEVKADLLKKGIHFSNVPVAGTIKRGELFPFPITKDKDGDTTNYTASKAVKNPLTSMDTVEAERLYLINCAICHGAALDGNGPLYKGGDGPFPAAPKNFMGDKGMIAMPEGQMFYSATYGKNKMGSYASQLNTHQRWMVVAYIKAKQAAQAAAGGGGAAAADTTAKK